MIASITSSFGRFLEIHRSLRFLFMWLFISTAIILFSAFVVPVLSESVIFLQALGVPVLLLLVFDFFHAATNSSKPNVFPKLSESVFLLLWLLFAGIVFYLSGYNHLSSLVFIVLAVVGFFMGTKAVLT